MLMNQTVTIHSKNGDLTGVIGSKPPHVTKPEERKKVVPYDEMFIDIGAKDKEQAEEMVSIGDPITFKCWFEAFPNDLVMCKALDNRLGCYVMMEVLKRVDSKATVYGVGTTQEEVGLKGAKVTSYKLNPDMAFALDVTLFINENQEYANEFKEVAESTILCHETDYDLNLFGKFNKLNAGLSESCS